MMTWFFSVFSAQLDGRAPTGLDVAHLNPRILIRYLPGGSTHCGSGGVEDEFGGNRRRLFEYGVARIPFINLGNRLGERVNELDAVQIQVNRPKKPAVVGNRNRL
jgi:hypothetical protein